jgi:hypothetical protein
MSLGQVKAGRQFPRTWSAQRPRFVQLHNLHDGDNYFFNILATLANQQRSRAIRALFGMRIPLGNLR